MEIKRSKKVLQNGIEEYRWHYDWNTVNSWFDKFKIYIFVFYASHLLFHSVFYSLPLLILLLLNIISLRILFIIIILYFTSYFIYKPFKCKNNTLPWYPEWFKKHSFWEWIKFYADWITIRRGPDNLYKNKQFLYCIHPHGILAINRIEMLGHIWFNEVQPQTFGRYAAATPQFWVPGVRETSIWAAAVDASKRVLNTVLSNGESIYLWPGGTKELLTTDPSITNKESKMVILNRFGFIKLALSHGVDIVPVCQFGEKWIYRKYIFPSWIASVLYKFCKTPAILFFGRFGCSLIPFHERPNGKPIRMGMVIGEPIKVKKMNRDEIDFERDVKPIHQEYMKRMKFLFETYKKDFHYDDDETLTFISSK